MDEKNLITYSGYIFGLLGLIWGAFSYGKKADKELITVEFCQVIRGVINEKLEDIKKVATKLDEKVNALNEKVDIKVSSLKDLIESRIK